MSLALIANSATVFHEGIDQPCIDWTSISASLHLMEVFLDPYEVVGPAAIQEIRRRAIFAGTAAPWELPMSFSQGHHFVALSEDVEEGLVWAQSIFEKLIPRLREAVRRRTAYREFLTDWVSFNRAVELYHAHLRVRDIYNARLVTSIRSGQMQSTKQQEMFNAVFLRAHAPGFSQDARRKAEELLLDVVWQIHLRQVTPPVGWQIGWFERMLVKKNSVQKTCECKRPRVCGSCSPFERSLAGGYYRASTPNLLDLIRVAEEFGIILPPTDLAGYRNFNPTLKG